MKPARQAGKGVEVHHSVTGAAAVGCRGLGHSGDLPSGMPTLAPASPLSTVSSHARNSPNTKKRARTAKTRSNRSRIGHGLGVQASQTTRWVK